jgi:mannose-1-phosphate guanylyltransferase
MKALILAAGQGTRLKSLTEHRPKPMLPIRSKPLLQHTVEWLRGYGVVELAMNVHYRPDLIMQHFGDGAALDVSIHYSCEKELLGTAGAAKKLEAFLDEEFVIVYGDVFTNMDLSRLHKFHKQPAAHGQPLPVLTLALYSVPDPTQCGLVETNAIGRITRFVEKPPLEQVFTDLAFSGIMICRPDILRHVPMNAFFDFGHDLIPLLLAKDVPMFAQAIAGNEFVIDIGTLPGYLTALKTYSETAQQEGAPFQL